MHTGVAEAWNVPVGAADEVVPKKQMPECQMPGDSSIYNGTGDKTAKREK